MTASIESKYKKNAKTGTGSAYTVAVSIFIVLFWLYRLFDASEMSDRINVASLMDRIETRIEENKKQNRRLMIGDGVEEVPAGGDALSEDYQNSEYMIPGQEGFPADMTEQDMSEANEDYDALSQTADEDYTGDASGADLNGEGSSPVPDDADVYQGNDAGAELTASDNDAPDEKRVFTTVDDSYFSDALFIGDSRMVGIYDYCGWDDAVFLCDNGYSVYGFGEGREVVCQNTGFKTTPETVLKERDFGKVYLMIGTNDCPSKDYNAFKNTYGYLVKLIKYTQPDAVIYLVSNLRMSKDGEEGNRARGFDNDRMGRLNEIISSYDDGGRIIYLDINEPFIDEEGYLPESYTFDGFHLYAKQYGMLGDYLREHGVDKENLW